MPVLLLLLVPHAEAKAIVGNTVEGSTLFVTKYPCVHCSQLIIDTGIHKVVYFGKKGDYVNCDLLIEKLGADKIEQLRLIFYVV